MVESSVAGLRAIDSQCDSLPLWIWAIRESRAGWAGPRSTVASTGSGICSRLLRAVSLTAASGSFGEHEQHGRQLEGLEGQGAPGRHPPHLEGCVPARVLLGLGRQAEADLLSARGGLGQRAGTGAVTLLA